MASTTRSTRVTTAQLDARITRIEGNLDRLVALLGGDTPAKPVKKAAAKRTTRKAKAKTVKVTQGQQAQGKGGLTRTAWNHTLVAKVRFAGKKTAGRNKGKSFYSLIVQNDKVWAQVRDLRLEGLTPDEALAKALTLV